MHILKLLAMIVLVLGECAGSDKTTIRTFDLGGTSLTVEIWGEGDTIVAVPGLGSDSSDFRALAPLVAKAGYRFVAVNQRGIAGSTGKLQGLTLSDLAGDIHGLINALGIEKAHLLGWAMGNRTARLFGTLHPEKTRAIILLAAGGMVAPAPDLVPQANLSFAEPRRPEPEIFAALRKTLFSPAAGDALLRDYLAHRKDWPEARAAQMAATRSAPLEAWWSGGKAPMLVIQGLEDRMAPVGNGRALREQFPDRVQLVELPNAAHLMALERPAETAAAIIAFLKKHVAR